MGYADDLYTIDHVVGGLRICVVDPETQHVLGSGGLLAVFVQKGNSFGLLTKDIGRRIAMNSNQYSLLFQNGFIEEKLEGETLFTVSTIEEAVPEFVELTPDNKREFEDLFASNQELNPEDNLDYMRAFHAYSHDYRYPSIGSLILSSRLKNAEAKAILCYLKATRPCTPEDMELAKAECAQVVSNLGVPGYKIAHNYRENLSDAQVVTSFGALLSPSLEPIVCSNEDTVGAATELSATEFSVAELPVAELPVAKRIEVESLEKRNAQEIVNKSSYPSL